MHCIFKKVKNNLIFNTEKIYVKVLNFESIQNALLQKIMFCDPSLCVCIKLQMYVDISSARTPRTQHYIYNMYTIMYNMF